MFSHQTTNNRRDVNSEKCAILESEPVAFGLEHRRRRILVRT